MLTAVEWASLGVAATLLSVFTAHRLGWIQVSLMRDAHALNIKKATPKIGSRVQIEIGRAEGRLHITGAAIHTKIYNDGDLVARNVEGEWKLTATEGINKQTYPIRADSLPTFLPFEFKREIIGVFSALWTKAALVLQVDIELVYLGMDDQPCQYHASYIYDFEKQQMIQQGHVRST